MITCYPMEFDICVTGNSDANLDVNSSSFHGIQLYSAFYPDHETHLVHVH